MRPPASIGGRSAARIKAVKRDVAASENPSRTEQTLEAVPNCETIGGEMVRGAADLRAVLTIPKTAKSFKNAGLITNEQKGEITSAAAQSSCGHKK